MHKACALGKRVFATDHKFLSKEQKSNMQGKVLNQQWSTPCRLSVYFTKNALPVLYLDRPPRPAARTLSLEIPRARALAHISRIKVGCCDLMYTCPSFDPRVYGTLLRRE